MSKKIIRYSQDKNYYEKMSERAKERASKITNMKEQFIKVIKQAENSESFL